ncbi:hypothetical protein GCM10010954_30400 [Halobacillus andaensis]|uniref:Uncharacterized protein n=1 Tax=Halobacillus andaensis TaxID=1176239 RepID=A0A917BB11_HALAA|nr:hypothetical protein [Halobacillus andaensis]MBP2005145.1 hypothetical protein [Halobacillus andaensis]GGF29189.1 hypothetical protein GCM10010954_30400 [Halobacillus andaensis]
MEKTKTIWVDPNKKYGILKIEDEVFGASFHPIEINSSDPWKYTIINNLWYTTYNGARQYFRVKTNPHVVTGRMVKIQLVDEKPSVHT